ncbi:MAG: 3-dehydroquinate synthase [Clostridia bacterium]|nr:3-dehydroquinate synthase [Clostridia bacterium]
MNDVLIARGLIDQAGIKLAEVIRPCRTVVVSDENVAPLYADRVCKSLATAGFTPSTVVLPAGEATKCGMQYIALLEKMAEAELTRSDLIVALGGGVIGDLAGFAAATYLRGIAVAQIPTTLLAAVDSSVGGKTAIDLQAGKNLVGAFHLPIRVLCDPATLSTLPPEQMAVGMAESIKYGVLFDEALFELLANGAPPELGETISRCVGLKQAVVARDFHDKGERQLLNLGHTFGHAIEACSGYTILHGEAVAIGMRMAARAALLLGIAEEDICDAVTSALLAADLPITTPYSAEALTAAALHDKKRAGGTINLVLPVRIGKCVLHPLPVEQLGNLMEEICAWIA